jgi:hypothetical protein
LVKAIIKEDKEKNEVNKEFSKVIWAERRTLKPHHIEFIKEYIKRHDTEYYTVRMLKDAIEHNFEDIKTVSERTIRRTLKRDLRMSYKKLDKMVIKSKHPDNIRKFLEAAIVQVKLRSMNCELIFLDKFTVSTRKYANYGWAKRGKKRYIANYNDNFSMSFIVCFSEEQVYGITGVVGGTKSSTIIRFLRSVIKCRNEKFAQKMKEPVFVLDNASVHTASVVQGFIEKSRVKMITIMSYSPSLNPTEKVILAIK